MAGATRVPTAAPRAGTLRPTSNRSSIARASSLAPASQATRSRHGANSPADALAASQSHSRSPDAAGTKRKERHYEIDGGEETNINVVVRCRGRNEREVRENSGVVVWTEGARGKTVELSMGPNALSNKAYHFDKVFSPAADQGMIYDDVVAPILDDMLHGFNCTVFAYGQTGTGKTYTMSGDMSDTLGLLSDNAGIIPRVLSSLFRKLEAEGSDNSIKCSFIELYNEELRDLLSREESSKLKMYEDGQRKGHTVTVVQGVEETHIKSAAHGIKLLREGSHKRQVAATKCNDLSSRSHTVFTITAYVKTESSNGEDYVAAGKLNLVDLAGSENIQRSGAENKRAAEAGLINKSLLTLGRVINALVDRSSHIPYRESKLTRLLQDSLGGRTKTCIIATLSPAKSNLEETISTLDYAFRAKNIRNKPQINPLISKKTLLREFTAEIEKLKIDLIACRQRNGVYLTNEVYEEMTVESESRRILSEEQKAKIETMENNLRNKVQELFTLTNDFSYLKKDNESTRTALGSTNEVLKQTEIVLANTQRNLADEELLRKAHEATEEELYAKGGELINTIGHTIHDVHALRAKLKRKSDVQTANRTKWQSTQEQIDTVTKLAESRIHSFESQQRDLIDDLSRRMLAFVGEQLESSKKQAVFLEKSSSQFDDVHLSAMDISAKGRDEMNTTLEEIKTLRDEVKDQLSFGLQGLSTAASRIAKEVIDEMESLHSQLHDSYSSLGQDFKSMFEELSRHVSAQRDEAEALRVQAVSAMNEAVTSERKISQRIDQCLEEERQAAANDRQVLLSQISDLVNASAVSQDKRMSARFEQIRLESAGTSARLENSSTSYTEGMESWSAKGTQFHDTMLKSRDALKSKLKTDWTLISEQNAKIQSTTKSIHGETVRIVEQQMEEMNVQMQTLDSFVTNARSYNGLCHDNRLSAMDAMAASVRDAQSNSRGCLDADRQKAEDLKATHGAWNTSMYEVLESFEEQVYRPLAGLRETTNATAIEEYQVTGETPQKTEYAYPTKLPRTNAPSSSLASNDDQAAVDEPMSEIPDLFEGPPSPSKAPVFADEPVLSMDDTTGSRPATSDSSLREVNANANAISNSSTVSETHLEAAALSKSAMGPPPLKRQATENSRVGKGARGKENVERRAERDHVIGGRRLRTRTSVLGS